MIKLLTAEYNPPVAKFYEVLLKLGVVPQVAFVPVEEYLEKEVSKGGRT